MNNQRRQLLLKMTAAAVVGLFLLDRFVIEPVLQGWSEQTTRIAALREKVQRGRQLCERETALRARWAGMLRANLPEDNSAAEYAALKSVDRWTQTSMINRTSLIPSPWQHRDEGFDIYECRMSATGNQASLGRFLYELESDQSVPVSLEECEFATRDPRGSQLTLTARITFLRLKESSKKTTP
ncbi:MAG: hypothetical protein NTZ46_00235 [Verrucomicrobia bacterium]|nr:hypothetical protein [Verrucomicrobiota bacterium]